MMSIGKKKVASFAYVFNGKSVLLIKLPSWAKMFPGCWTIPGGGANDGETPESAAIREVYEETKVSAENLVEWRQAETEKLKTYIYTADAKATKTTPDAKEVDAASWFTYKEVKDLELGFNNRELLDQLHEQGMF